MYQKNILLYALVRDEYYNYVKNNKRVLFYIYRKIEATKIINIY